MLPISDYPKAFVDRIRQAGHKNRKKKKVRTTRDDGVIRYCYHDVMRWFGQEIVREPDFRHPIRL